MKFGPCRARENESNVEIELKVESNVKYQKNSGERRIECGARHGCGNMTLYIFQIPVCRKIV